MLESFLVAAPGLFIAAVFLAGETYFRLVDEPRYRKAAIVIETRRDGGRQ